jgi:hypothetical protein
VLCETLECKETLALKQHVNKVAGVYHLRRLRQIRRHVNNELMAQLIAAFITSRLDYCNSVLACLPACTIAPLQRVQNAAAARLLLSRSESDHISDCLKASHWLPIQFRVEYKLRLLMHSMTVNRCPAYLKVMVSLCTTSTRFEIGRCGYKHLHRPENYNKARRSCVFVLRANRLEQTASWAASGQWYCIV